MGIWQKIKNWFRQLTTPETQLKEVKLDKPAKTEVDDLVEENTTLEGERVQIRKDLVQLDEKYNMGEIEAAEHDRHYRQGLARAGQIRLRQIEIRARLAELGSPLPEPEG